MQEESLSTLTSSHDVSKAKCPGSSNSGKKEVPAATEPPISIGDLGRMFNRRGMATWLEAVIRGEVVITPGPLYRKFCFE